MKLSLGIVGIIAVSLLFSGCLSAGQDKQKISELEKSVLGLQKQLEALGEEKNKTEETLLHVTLQKEDLNSKLLAKSAEVDKARAEEKAKGLANARAVKAALDSSGQNKSALLDAAKQAYTQWEFYACQYYLGVNVFTSGGNITVPIGCVFANSQYVQASQAALNALGTDDAAIKARQELLKQYPELNSS